MKIAYVGYDAFFYVLSALLSAGHTVHKVFSFKTDNQYEFNCRLRAFSEEQGISFTEERMTERDIDALLSAGVRLVICAGYIYRLPVSDRLMMVNFHPAPLPVGRGVWPMPLAILRNMSYYGSALHRIAEGFDTGDILLQNTFPLSGNENLETLLSAVEAHARPMLDNFFSDIEGCFSRRRPQTDGEVFPDPSDMNLIYESDPAPQIARTLRAFYGYETRVVTDSGEYAIRRGIYRKKRPNGISSDRFITLRNGGIEIISP